MQKKAKRPIKILFVLASVLSAVFYSCVYYFSAVLPDKYYVSSLGRFYLETPVPVSCDTGEIFTPVNSVDDSSRYNASLKLLGIFPLKSVEVQLAQNRDVVVLGQSFGIKFYTKGVLVTDLQAVDSQCGSISPGEAAGIKAGDIIAEIGGIIPKDSAHAAQLFKESEGKAIAIRLQRGDKTVNTALTPVYSVAEKCYKAGLWIKDSTAGIGTLTFYSPYYNVVAGLGHAVADAPSQTTLPLLKGEMVPAEIVSVAKSTNGSPGELHGRFGEGMIGNIVSNDETGVYAIPQRGFTGNNVTLAFKQEVREGEAYIITNTGQAPKAYKCKISKINYDSRERTKNMLIRITDPELLTKTGGIVQGMSGSPIIQDGKLVGAVTHVLVNDCTCGYAIFAENMLETAKEINNIEYLEKAS